MNSDQIASYVHLRLVVAYLGEKDGFSWWNTGFLGKTGAQYLAYNFPRTTLSAGLHGASEAARRLHDDRIGRGRVFHLFRLPVALEEEVHRYVLQSPESASAYITSQETAMNQLRDMAAGSSTEVAEGPVKVAALSQVLESHSVSEMARAYLSAFEGEFRSFPYLGD